MIWNNLSEQCLELLAKEVKKEKLYMREQHLEACYNGEHIGHLLLAKREPQNKNKTKNNRRKQNKKITSS